MRELDIFHPSYRVKRLNRKLDEPQSFNDDLMIDVLHNESLGLIDVQITVENDGCSNPKMGNKLFEKMLNLYRVADENASTRWKHCREGII